MSQQETAPTTKSGTSEKSSQKKRGAPKGGWKKFKEEQAKAEALLKGNSDFTLTKEMEEKAMAALTDEDLALDRELDLIAQERMAQGPIDDVAPAIEVQKVRENLEHLSSYVDDYKPASTMAELNEQVHVAKSEGCDAIDATADVIKKIFRADFEKIEKELGFGIYHDVRVFLTGRFEGLKNMHKVTMEQKLFPAKK